VDAFFTTYFETLAHYSNNRQQLASDVAKEPAFESPEAAQRAAARVSWFGSEANCQEWFNVGLPGVAAPSRTERIIDVIAQVSEVMIRVGDVSSDPLGGNPYSITNSEVLRRTCSHFGAAPGIGVQPVAFQFGPIPDEEWSRLRTIGRIRIVPISFDPSTATLTRDGVAVLEQVATALANNYPQYRVLVRGHTAPSGNEQANVALSQERADAVKAQLVAGYGLEPNRLHSVGLGAAEPLPRQPGEGELSYRNRLPRVEFVLVENRS
jgi:outer membrane protein OmpA-like peptidoglycan-associated protein